MRILVLTPTFLPMIGGAEILLFEIFRRLEIRHEIFLLTPDKNLPSSELDHEVGFQVTRYKDRFSFMNFPGHRLTGGIIPPFSFSAVTATYRAIKDFSPNVMNTHYMKHTGLAAVIAEKRFKVPNVLTFAGSDVPGPGTPWFWKYYDRWVAKSATEVTFVSEYCRQAIYGQGSNVGTVISNGVDLEKFTPQHDRSRIRQKLSFPQHSSILLAVQRLSPKKRVDIIIQAMPYILHRHPNTLLVIGGSGSSQPKLVSLVQQLGLSQSVLLMGHVPHNDLPLYYAMADIFVFHSTYETFGIVIAEAMASGTPVVSVRSTAIPEVVQEGHTGLLATPLDPIDMANKITDLLDSPSKIRKFGRNGRLWAEQHFDWDVIAEQYEKVLLEAANS
jgi:glycosyltransferase involved in cell wall biosynthesis